MEKVAAYMRENSLVAIRTHCKGPSGKVEKYFVDINAMKATYPEKYRRIGTLHESVHFASKNFLGIVMLKGVYVTTLQAGQVPDQN